MKTKNVTEKNMKVCLVGSSGGHLTHLYSGQGKPDKPIDESVRANDAQMVVLKIIKEKSGKIFEKMR